MKAVFLQKVVEMLEEVVVSWRERGQVNTADGAKVCSPIHSTFEALVVQHAVGCYCGELSPFC